MFSGRSSVSPVKPFKNYSGKTGSQKYTVICLTVIGICLVGLGAALIIVGIQNDVQDLLILGPIFLAAGIGFTILMVVIIARSIFEKRARKKAIKKKQEKQSKIKGSKGQDENGSIKATDSKPYIHDYKTKLREAENVNQRKGPPYDQLYGKHDTKELLKTNSMPPGVVEVSSGAYVEESEDVFASPKVNKSLPTYGQLYQDKKVTFSISSEPDNTPLNYSETKNIDTIEETRSVGTPVPSVVVYSLPNEPVDSNKESSYL